MVLPIRPRDLLEATAVATAMASAVERIRGMAATVFRGDAALFANSTDQPSP